MTPRELALIPLLVALNAAAGIVASQTGLPVYLDTLGTILAVALAGPRAGLAVGTVTQLLTALNVGGFMLFFLPIQWLVALAAWVVLRAGGFRAWQATAAWGLATGLAGGALSAQVSYAAFQGVTATGVTAITTLLRSLGLSLAQAVTVSSVGTDVLDKLVVFALAGVALRGLPRRLLHRFPLALRGLAA